jgi:2-polyprenyl-3-methyl-5-hydroxy-6-metoxy-1,4-benzoquinol methylase
MTNRHLCWICGAPVSLVRESSLPNQLTGAQFRITDADYGRTAAIYRCDRCNFHQCSEMVGVLNYYIEMNDQAYEATRSQRVLQERKLLHQIPLQRAPSELRLLDVGAGSGILVQEALVMGFSAEGVEPSLELQARAVELGLSVKAGVLPHPELAGPYDVITLVDVIEHVPDPVGLLKAVKTVLAPGGVIAVVTPDRRSVMARLMGYKWWHYRIAHIGYFDRATLDLALAKVDLVGTGFYRPTSYFPLKYITDRLIGYLPRPLRFRTPEAMNRITVPLNLRDSMMVICQRRF